MKNRKIEKLKIGCGCIVVYNIQGISFENRKLRSTTKKIALYVKIGTFIV